LACGRERLVRASMVVEGDSGHTGFEMTCVLAGGFSHRGGEFRPGDFDFGDAGACTRRMSTTTRTASRSSPCRASSSGRAWSASSSSRS